MWIVIVVVPSIFVVCRANSKFAWSIFQRKNCIHHHGEFRTYHLLHCIQQLLSHVGQIFFSHKIQDVKNFTDGFHFTVLFQNKNSSRCCVYSIVCWTSVYLCVISCLCDGWNAIHHCCLAISTHDDLLLQCRLPLQHCFFLLDSSYVSLQVVVCSLPQDSPRVHWNGISSCRIRASCGKLRGGPIAHTGRNHALWLVSSILLVHLAGEYCVMGYFKQMSVLC